MIFTFAIGCIGMQECQEETKETVQTGFILLMAAAAPYGHDHDKSAQGRLIAPLTIRVLSAPSQGRGVIR